MLNFLLNLFYPRNCLGCNEVLLSSENTVCVTCRHNIPLTHFSSTTNNAAFNKFFGKLHVENVLSLLYYHKNGISQQLIHNLKYKNHQEVGAFLAHWFSNEIQKTPLSKVDFIIPIPLHKKRLKERGYNQVDTFCETLSENLKIPLLKNMLYRNEYSTSQSKKNLDGRTSNIQSLVFDVAFNEELHGKHFLLVDDVLTTGATMELCGKAVLKIPNAKISVLTMAFAE